MRIGVWTACGSADTSDPNCAGWGSPPMVESIIGGHAVRSTSVTTLGARASTRAWSASLTAFLVVNASQVVTPARPTVPIASPSPIQSEWSSRWW